MTTLQTIPVLFNQEEHTYTHIPTGESLKGVTSTLLRRLFPDKYKDIPAHILASAAERGHNVHTDIELSESLGVTPSTTEGKNYQRVKAENNLRFLASEYLVSDLENYASQIDLVFEEEENIVSLADVKTTSKFDRESVSWQLSIYSYFLRLNNPDIKVGKLYGIWLRGEVAQLIEVEAHTDEEVKALIQSDLEDTPFEYNSPFPEYIISNETRLMYLDKKIKELTQEYDEIKSEVLSKMEENKDKSFDTGRVLFTFTGSSEKTSFDSKKFREDNAELYDKYIKKTKVKPSLRLTFR